MKKKSMQVDGMTTDLSSVRRFLKISLNFLLYAMLGPIVPDVIAYTDTIIKIPIDTFSIGETWIYRDSSYYRSSGGPLGGNEYTYTGYHIVRIIDKFSNRDCRRAVKIPQRWALIEAQNPPP